MPAHSTMEPSHGPRRRRASRPLGVVIALAAMLLAPGSTLAWDISRVTNDRVISAARAAVDANGHRHIVYQSVRSLVYLTDASGHWARSVVATDWTGGVDIAVTPSGSVHVVFVANVGGHGALRHATRADGSWVAETIADPVFASVTPSIAVTSDGIVDVAWLDDGVHHAWRGQSGIWSVAVRSRDDGYGIDIAMGQDGHAHLAWDDGFGRIRVATDAGGSWTTTTVASGDAWDPRIAMDAAGTSHVAYHRWGTSPGTYHATDAGGSWNRRRLGAPSTGYDIAAGAEGPVVTWAPTTGGLLLARRSGAAWHIDSVVGTATHVTDPSVGLAGGGRDMFTWLTSGGIHGSDETAGTYPVNLIEPVLGDTFTPDIAAAPDGSLRMTLATCGGSRQGVRLGSNAGGAWTWTSLSEGCARRAALDLDLAGHAHVATDAWYATDESGSWASISLPGLPDTGNYEEGWETVALGGARSGRPVVVLDAVDRDAGYAHPETFIWHPGDTGFATGPSGSGPSVATSNTAGTVIGTYDWYYDGGYFYHRPSAVSLDGDSSEAWTLASAGRYAAVAARAGGGMTVAYTRLGAPIGYLATGQEFPDALAASSGAARADGFVTLTRTTTLPAATRQELARLRPEALVIAGGSAAVSASIETTVAPYGYSSAGRVAGADRYATAAAIAYGVVWDCCSTVYIASGTSFPDAMAASTIVGERDGLLLVTRDGIPTATRQHLTSAAGRIVILGGTGAVSGAVEAQLRTLAPQAAVSRIAGADRYATAATIARTAYPKRAPVVYLATGEAFPDGLVAGAAAAHEGGPLLLTRRGDLPTSTRNELVRLQPDRVVVVGGTGAVSSAVVAAIRTALPGARVIRVAGADRYATAAAITRYAFEDGAGVYMRDLEAPTTKAALVTSLIPPGPLDLAIAPDGTARIAFDGPVEQPGIHVAIGHADGSWTMSRVTRDAWDFDPKVVAVGGRTYVVWDRGSDGIFLAAH